MCGEGVDFLQASDESPVEGSEFHRGRLHGEDFIWSSAQDVSQAHEQGAMKPEVSALVLRDEGLMDSEFLRYVDLAEASAFADFLKALTEGFLVGCGNGVVLFHEKECRGGLTHILIIKYIWKPN